MRIQNSEACHVSRGQNPEARSRKLSPVFCLLSPRRSAATGFTLIELLVVITIIAILAGLTIGASKYALTKAAISRTKGEIKAMEAALEDYKADNGVYPPSTAFRVDAVNNCTNLYNVLAGGQKKYMTFKVAQLRQVSATATNILDAFGKPYNYYRNPSSPSTQTNQVTYDLWSYGPDGQDSTGDDITNWQSF